MAGAQVYDLLGVLFVVAAASFNHFLSHGVARRPLWSIGRSLSWWQRTPYALLAASGYGGVPGG